jgi:hypothetical protein
VCKSGWEGNNGKDKIGKKGERGRSQNGPNMHFTGLTDVSVLKFFGPLLVLQDLSLLILKKGPIFV